MDICTVLQQVKALTGPFLRFIPKNSQKMIGGTRRWGVTFTLALSDLTAAREGL